MKERSLEELQRPNEAPCVCVQVKNSFISLLIDVQNRQKEHRDLLRKKKKIRSTTTTGPNGQRTASTHIPGTVSRVMTCGGGREQKQTHKPFA